MKYKYKAKKTDGTDYEGIKDAKDKFALYRDIRQEGGTVVSVKEGDHTGIDWKKLAKMSLLIGKKICLKQMKFWKYEKKFPAPIRK